MTAFSRDPNLVLMLHETERVLRTADALSEADLHAPSLLPAWSCAYMRC